MKNLHKAEFVIDSIPNKFFKGFSTEETWNGWACPYFEKDESERILKLSEANGFTWSYDAKNDAFIVRSDYGPDELEPEIFEASTVEIDGKEIVVYGIGTYSWIWEIAE